MSDRGQHTSESVERPTCEKWSLRAVFGGRRTTPTNKRPGEPEHSRTWRKLTYGLKLPEADTRLKQVKPEQEGIL